MDFCKLLVGPRPMEWNTRNTWDMTVVRERHSMRTLSATSCTWFYMSSQVISNRVEPTWRTEPYRTDQPQAWKRWI